MTENKLFLLDGMALVYRGHFAMIRNPRLTSKGMNTSALFVFANTLLDVINNQGATHLVAAFDTPEPTHRHKSFADYKAQREAMPEDIGVALPYVYQMCDAFNVPVVCAPGWEADDVVGTLVKMADKAGDFKSFMVTPDKDYGQLVSDTAFMFKPGRSGNSGEILGVKEILDQWGIERVGQVIDILGLMGDSSDNVPGVPGIGPKTAQKLIAKFGSVENLLDHTEELKGKQKENLENYRDQALLSKHLVTIDCNVPLEVQLKDLVVAEKNETALMALFEGLEFDALGKRVFGERFSAGPTASPTSVKSTDKPPELKTIKEVKHQYHLVDTHVSRVNLSEKLLKEKAICFDLETTGLNPKTCSIIGFAFSFEAHTGYYVPIPQDSQEATKVIEQFRPVFEDPNIEKIGHNIKFDYSVLLWNGVQVKGKFFDTMLAAALATPDLRRSMDYLSQALMGYIPIKISTLIGEKGENQKTLLDVPVEKVAEYATEDADVTFRLSEILRSKINEMGQERVFEEVECPLVAVLANMEYEGIRLDKKIITHISSDLNEEIESSRKEIFELAGEKFNLNSPKQLGDILFDKLKLDPNARKTAKTGQYQTGESILQRISHKHRIIERIINYRICTKLKSTYVNQLPGAVFKGTGRIHTHYEQLVTATGRLQSHGPNLQNIPIRTEKGREIRRAFVARGEEFKLLSADYSQIELRIAAELNKDPDMLRTFQEGGDIHSATAMKVYGLSEEDVTDEMRRRAKTVNFGILYGISAFGLAERLDIPRLQANELIEQYFDQFPGAKKYMDETIAFAREQGYVETVLGRRRYLRDINSRNTTTRKSEERNAINSRIQGSAADMIKIAMHRIFNEMAKNDLKSRMLLQVHDELVFDMHRDEEEILKPIVETEMKQAIPMEVPIVVEMGVGDSWLEAH